MVLSNSCLITMVKDVYILLIIHLYWCFTINSQTKTEDNYNSSYNGKMISNNIKSLHTTWGGLKQNDVASESVSFIHPACQWILVGALNPFTFKVIIDIYDPITIFLIASGLFCADLFFLLCFLPREVPLVFAVKLVWWCWILFNFCLSGKLLISPSNLRESLAG